MQYILRFFHFWYDFIIGDDWISAIAVVVSLAMTFGLAQAHIHAWWLMPIVVVSSLWLSLVRATQP